MLDAQRIVEEIKHLLYSSSNPLPDEVASLAGDYLDLCNVANDRLRECSRLLRLGHRSEAIQMAERDTNLVDLVATLDFAERAQWWEYVRQAGELLPPELMLDEAAELNEAYAAEQPLTRLLQRHRLLALARAPLAERLTVVRQLAAADAANPVWEQDQITFEQALEEQISQELAELTRVADVDGLARLEAELAAPGWRAPPRDGLAQQVRQVHDRVRRQQARDELAELEPQLTEAHANFDLAQGRALRARWQACAALADLASHELLAEMAEPSLAWLAQSDRGEQNEAEFRAVVAKLERKLDGSADRAELERLYYEAARHDLELPPTLNVRFRERIFDLETSASRRFKLLVVAAVFVLVALGGATIAAVKHKLFSDEVAATVENLKKLIDENKLPDAQELLSDVERSQPAVAANASVRDLAARLQGLQTDEAGRRVQFEEAMAAAETAATFSAPTLQSLKAAQSRLKSQVSPLAKSPTERARVDELDRKILASRIEVQRAIDVEFARRVEDSLARLTQIEQGRFAPADSTEDALAELKKQTSSLREQTQASPALVSNLDALSTRIETQQKAMNARRDRAILTSAITRAVGSRSRFLNELVAYGNHFPDTARAHSFQKAVQEAPLWEAFDRWEEVLRVLKFEEPVDFVAQAKKLHDDPLMAAFKVDGEVQQRFPYCETALQRPQEKVPPAVSGLLDNPLISTTSMAEVSEGGALNHYYVLKEPKDQPVIGKVTIEYLVDFQLNKKIHSIRKDEFLKFDDSPQRKLAERLRDIFVHKPGEGWELKFSRALHEVTQDDKTDPILRVVLLKRLVEIGSEGSRVLTKVFADLGSQLNGGGLDFEANWLLPDLAANKQRETAKKILAGLPSVLELSKRAQEKLRQLAELPRADHDWFGWLSQDDQPLPAWTCQSTIIDRRDGELAVVYRPQADGPVRIEKIGRYQAGKVEITATPESESLVEGRPVFRLSDPEIGTQQNKVKKE